VEGDYRGIDGPHGSVEIRRYAVRCSPSVINSLWRESACTQHCVQLGTGRQLWQGNCTDVCPLVALQRP
jgi:hypothetical protein